MRSNMRPRRSRMPARSVSFHCAPRRPSTRQRCDRSRRHSRRPSPPHPSPRSVTASWRTSMRRYTNMRPNSRHCWRSRCGLRYSGSPACGARKGRARPRSWSSVRATSSPGSRNGSSPRRGRRTCRTRERWRRRFLSFDKILIANRGEIALRVIRACRELGVQTVLVYSEADAHSLPVHLADEAICVGPAAARQSYLNIPAIMSAALISGAQAIHPGYGFLAENADFAEVCKEHGLVFIGPPAEVLRRFHDKVATRIAMKKLGLPVIPGSDGPVKTMAEALRIAEAVGYPVMLKARSGGGGRGMRKVTAPQELQRLWDQASSEAKASFGDAGLYVERCLEGVRHVEAQIAVDEYGSGICLGERECSIQRRNQKMIEEPPCASDIATSGRSSSSSIRVASTTSSR